MIYARLKESREKLYTIEADVLLATTEENAD